MLSDTAKKEFRVFAEKIAIEAGNILITKKNDFIVKKVKDNQQIDIATSADYASEEYIISQINKQYHSHSILAEETGLSNIKSDFQWIIDPLDGTKEYAKGVPYYYVLIALEYRNKLVAGAAYQPETKRLFSADTKAYLNAKQIHVSKEALLSKTFISMPLPNSRMPVSIIKRTLSIMEPLCQSAYRIRSTQWDIDSLNHVASGAYDGYIAITSTQDISHTKWWDIAPGILMVQSAGGKVTDLDGKKITDKSLPNGIVASNGLIHDQLLKIIHL